MFVGENMLIGVGDLLLIGLILPDIWQISALYSLFMLGNVSHCPTYRLGFQIKTSITLILTMRINFKE